MDEKPYKYENLPIPSYEEATASRPASAQSRLGAQEISDDAERQGLLRSGSSDNELGRNNYAPPTVESGRSSLDSIDGMGVESEAEVRREMQQMDIEEPDSDNGSHRSLLSYRFKRFTSLTNSLPSLKFPSFSRLIPSVSWPQINWEAIDANRVVILGRLFGIFIIVGLLYVLVASDVLSFRQRGMGMSQMYDPESVRAFVQSGILESDKVHEYLKHITQYPHIAGTEGNYVLGEWVAELFKDSELEGVSMERFDVYLNYPRKDGRMVAIVEPENERWQAQLEENLEETAVFHGHSKSGDVTGPLIYANFGSRDDFKTLADQGISVTGAVVLVRYYGSEGDRALKVKAAELAGAIGCVIYSDPAQDGYVQGPTFPDGRFRPIDGVQRGAVSLMSWVVGDVLSPGWASTPGEKRRIKPEDSEGLNRIPSLPLAWRDAQHLLKSLEGHGKEMTGDWAGEPNTKYFTGDQDSPKVNLKNLQDEEVRQPIYNVLGKIKGWESPKKKIIVGNHRDAWCTGAADPGSGTAIMLEVVRIFGELRRRGWRPMRTIEFASWDGEEYNLIGSTEHVENREKDLRDDGVAYINIDVGVTGVDFHASASPMFERPLKHVLERVTDPNTNRSLYDIWEEKNIGLEGLGAGSDFVAFQDIVGTSSLDMSFEGQEYPYHSCYDNFEWMSRFGDPGWNYHKAMGQVIALLILEIADHPLLPFDLRSYARAVVDYINKLEADINHSATSLVRRQQLDLQSLKAASEFLTRQTATFHEFDDQWHNFVYGSDGFESTALTERRVKRNNRMSKFETNLLDLTEGGGLVNRTQFKHVIFGPQKWSGYDEAYFPGIRDLVEIGDWNAAQKEVEKVASIVETAASYLTLD